MNQNNYFTEQEAFWAGEFGDDYIGRNKGENQVASNIMFFSKILLRIGSIESAIEFVANIGLNLLAMKQLLPSAKFAAIEINDKAARELKHIQGVDVYQDSILNFTPAKKYELVLAKGVLIHIAPDRLIDVYERLYQASSKFILLAEYYIIQRLLKFRIVVIKRSFSNVTLRGKCWIGFLNFDYWTMVLSIIEILSLKTILPGFSWKNNTYINEHCHSC